MEYERLTERRGNLVIDKCGNCENVSNPQGCTEHCCYEIMKNRLAELEDKIDQGTLIELPIPYGTELHFLWSREHATKPQPPKVHSTKEWIFNVRSDGKMWLSSNDIPCGYYGEYLHELGKTVFLTREEAEKRLKEIQK